MADIQFVVEHGMLQAKDINPAVPGESTADLTNPRFEAKEDAQQELISGEMAKRRSPLVYLLAVVVVLMAFSLFQK